MFSKILSLFLRIGFVLALTLAVLKIISEIRQNKIAFFSGKYEVILATPGIDLLAIRQLGSEHFAPDTVVRFRTVNPKGDSILLAISTSNARYRKLALGAIPIDSERTVILDSRENFIPGDSLYTTHSDGSRTRRARFPINIFGGVIEKGEPKQILRVLPRSNQQHFVFVLIDVIYYGSIVLIWFFVMRLFSKFGNKEYFTRSIIRILKATGWLVLVWQMVMEIFYRYYRSDFYPAKGLFSNGDSKIFAMYSLTSNLDFFKIMAGFFLIVISYGFKKGLLYKIDSDLNI